MSLYHAFRQHDEKGWGILRRDSAGSVHAVIVAANLTAAGAAEYLGGLTAIEVGWSIAASQCPGCGANQTTETGACCWCGTIYRASAAPEPSP